jgi:hypothetical protein
MGSGQASTDTLQAVLNAFNAHDLDRIMTFFSTDCVSPAVPEPRGGRGNATRDRCLRCMPP